MCIVVRFSCCIACGAGNAEAIILLAENNGFTVVQRKDEEALEEDQVKEFYAEHAEKDFFETLVGFMTSGPVVKLVLERPNAIKAWRCARFVQGNASAAAAGLILAFSCAQGPAGADQPVGGQGRGAGLHPRPVRQQCAPGTDCRTPS